MVKGEAEGEAEKPGNVKNAQIRHIFLHFSVDNQRPGWYTIQRKRERPNYRSVQKERKQ